MEKKIKVSIPVTPEMKEVEMTLPLIRKHRIAEYAMEMFKVGEDERGCKVWINRDGLVNIHNLDVSIGATYLEDGWEDATEEEFQEHLAKGLSILNSFISVPV